MKNYIIPATTIIAIHSSFVCQVASVQGNGPSYGGEDNTIDPG